MPNFIPGNIGGGTRGSLDSTSTTNSSTLQSRDMYYRPPVPRQSSAGGLQGADGRGYVRDVQGNETVRQQMEGLLNSDSDYIQNARQRGIEAAASRGNVNSSIAAGNSQRAAIEAGLPIAQQDAATYAQTAGQNQDAMNQNLMQERDIANRVMLDREGRLSALEQARLQADVQRLGINTGLLDSREQRAYSGEQQGLDRAHQFGMAGYQTQLSDWMNNQNFGRSEFAADRNLYRNEYSADQNLNRNEYSANQNFGRSEFAADRNLYRNEYSADQNLNRNEYSADQNLNRSEYAAQQGFNRGMYAALAESQVGSLTDFMSRLSQAWISDPQTYGDPNTLSGMSNFFDQNIIGSVMEGLWAQFFPQQQQAPQGLGG